MPSLDMRNAEDVCGYDAYNKVRGYDLDQLSMKACSNFDEKGAQCARHLLVTNPTASTKVGAIGIDYNNTTGKYTVDKLKCESLSGGRRKRRTKKSKNGGKSKKSGGRRRRRTQRRNR